MITVKVRFDGNFRCTHRFLSELKLTQISREHFPCDGTVVFGEVDREHVP